MEPTSPYTGLVPKQVVAENWFLEYPNSRWMYRPRLKTVTNQERNQLTQLYGRRQVNGIARIMQLSFINALDILSVRDGSLSETPPQIR